MERSALALVGMLLTTPIVAMGQTSAGSAATPPPQIVTTATGEATVVPDRATIIFAVETRAATAAAAAAENARRQKAVVDAVRAKGIAAEQVSTLGFSVSANERYDDGQRKVVGYIARNGVLVNVLKIDQVGALIDAALAAGSNQVSGLNFYSTKFEEVRRSALEQAISRARADAEAMARAAGGTLGAPIELMTNDPGFPRPMAEMAMRTMAQASDSPETPIAVGEQKVTVSVTTRWQFVGGSR